ncbi:shikimate kinase [Bacillus sp. SCS-153A]|uniref:shikimate kinase n=1 Tax=Rossellomorea sedimentorum TaxID=3115294 RepID=UPI003906753D
MIFLIGFMGTGKTTIGNVLAQKLQCPCVDTDQLIEEKYSMRIKEIFEEYGEERFREMETETLQELKEEEIVVMTGGGMADRKVNRELMKEKGKVVWLNCEFNEIIKRIANDASRPLVMQKGLTGLKSLYEKRLPVYDSAADYTIETSAITVDETVKRIISCLNIDRPGETNR